MEDEKVILIKPYEVSTATTSSISQTSFITEEVENLSKYIKFIRTPTQTRIFRPPLHCQSLKSRGEQDPIFWKEVATTFVEMKHNTDTLRNGFQIKMFQGSLPHKPYFIAIDNMEQIIVGPSKKIVATHVVRELAVMVWFMGTWMLKTGYCYDRCFLVKAWTRVKSMMMWSAAPHVVLVSTSCSKCCYLTLSLWSSRFLYLMYASLFY